MSLLFAIVLLCSCDNDSDNNDDMDDNLPPEENLFDCEASIDFEDQTLNETFTPGVNFTASEHSVYIGDFTFGDGTSYAEDTAQIQNSISPDSTGLRLWFENTKAGFYFGGDLSGLSLRYSDYGGNSNIVVNGELVIFKEFSEIDGTTISGVDISARIDTPSYISDLGILQLDGDIRSFAIGGQELAVDNLCVQYAETSGDCDVNMAFEDQTLGEVLTYGDEITASGYTVNLQEFTFGDGDTTDEGEVYVSNNLMAGGSGLDIGFNNLNANFDFDTGISGLSMRYGAYGGNLNIEINGEFVNFEQFSEIDGTTIGGVELSLPVYGGDRGILKLSGTISSLLIGGQELWIDDVCISLP
ncbi:hypothetical protein [Sinomicrobium sp.]